MPWRSRPENGQAGAVVAEFAVVLPAVVLVFACCLGGLRVGIEALRLGDATAAAARMLGRGDPARLASNVVRAHSGGAITTVDRAGGLVCVTAASELRIGWIAPPPISARSCALDDE